MFNQSSLPASAILVTGQQLKVWLFALLTHFWTVHLIAFFNLVILWLSTTAYSYDFSIFITHCKKKLIFWSLLFMPPVLSLQNKRFLMAASSLLIYTCNSTYTVYTNLLLHISSNLMTFSFISDNCTQFQGEKVIGLLFCYCLHSYL